MHLKKIDISELEITSLPCKIHHDLHIYIDYVITREVKRAHRTNDLPKSDTKRLLKQMAYPDKSIDDGYSPWVDFIDRLALNLSFVDYDTKGSYAGYSSYESSYPDNYINYHDKNYQKFLNFTLQEQEQYVLNGLIDRYSYDKNEFLDLSAIGILDQFSHSGCACGVLPSLRFNEIRRFLLALLGKCDVNVWYSTADLCQHLKQHHPYFLIPKNPVFKYNHETNRYCNFDERKSNDYKSIQIHPDDTAAFERVEGRYLERFLEYIPLLMGYVDVAYAKESKQEILPLRNHLQAFRVNQRLVNALQGKITNPTITVQPNFEISVESQIYPATILNELREVGDVVSQDLISIVKMNKNKIINQVAENNKFDVVKYFEQLSCKPLPQNVAVELQEWTTQADAFILYENTAEGIGLLESKDKLPDITTHILQEIGKGLFIVNSPESVMRKLKAAHWVPIKVEHSQDHLKRLPRTYRTVFPKLAAKKDGKVVKEKKKREKIILKRQVRIKLFFPTPKILTLIKDRLLIQRRIFELHDNENAITIDQADESFLKEAIKSVNEQYQIQIQNEN